MPHPNTDKQAHRSKYNRTTRTFRVDADLMLRVDTRLHDPFTGKIRHGHLSILIESLLNKWLKGEVEVTLPTDDKTDPLKLQEFTQ